MTRGAVGIVRVRPAVIDLGGLLIDQRRYS
jgi:hypothetical protein